MQIPHSVLLSAALLASCTAPNAASSAVEAEPLILETRQRAARPGGMIEVVQETQRWSPERTAIIICDMWDDHWCRGAAGRVAELAVPMDEMIARVRQRGVFVIHAPSSVVSYYDGTPQRARARSANYAPTPVPLSTERRWGTTWCWPDAEREPDMPIDDSDMGCDCEPRCEIRDAWSRQIDTIRIEPGDAITDDGQETYNLLAERGIENVLLVGVHLNMCVLGRPFGIRQMVRTGKNVLLVRDMTDSMYNHEMRPYVSHFAGTDLVVEHVEQFWCPTILSSDLTDEPPFRFDR